MSRSPFRALWLPLCAAILLPLGASGAESASPSGKSPIVRLQMRYEPAALDPHKIDGLAEYRIATDLFEGLVTYSATDEVIPGVAERWETSADGLVWTFHLRGDAVWSDGAPVTADDFVFSLRRALDPATAGSYTLTLAPIFNAQEINAGREKDLTKLGVTALDPHTLQVTLVKPTPWFLASLTGQTSMPVPRQAIEKWGNKWTDPGHIVTNGAYALKSWVPLDEIDLMRNPHFHDAASVKVEEVDYVLADDFHTALKRYEVGDLDMTDVLGQDLPKLERERPAELHGDPLLSTRYITFNMSGPFGHDARVRRALTLVIDREALSGKVIRRGEAPAYDLVGPGIAGYPEQHEAWSDLPMAKRIAMAKELLAQSGVQQPLKIHLLSQKQDIDQLYVQAIVGMWRSALGVETEQEAVEPRVFFGRITQHDFEMVLAGWSADYPDPWTYLANFQSDGGQLNLGNYRNPEFDLLLERSRGAATTADRMALMASAEKLVLNDAAIIPISYETSRSLVNPRLHGYEAAVIDVHPSRFLSVTN
jgi:oligopeptide transport system substrate-binding protein